MKACPECDKALGPEDAFGHDCEVGATCDCPNCEAEEGDCLKNFCALCREEIGYETTWPDLCGQCIATEHFKSLA